jgi:asparagine synthase (glutamine-hydrolysing)
MCGIAGGMFWGQVVEPAHADTAIRAMVRSLAHRGPDGVGVYSPSADRSSGAPYVVFGHTRLAILDTSEAGAQPMTVENVHGRERAGQTGKSCITYNGETYNFRELRSELERSGRCFRTGTDTEVVLNGYEEWGLASLSRLRGMFAFGLWDPRAERLTLARDRLGIKPLYYYHGDGYFLFASEVRALLATGLVPRRLDANALWQYLGYQSIPAPSTLVRDVRLLEPASWVTIDGSRRKTRGTYWDMLAAVRTPQDRSADEVRRRTGELLREAVASHLVSDVPVGAFLSGGIDSSAVVALMREAGCRPRTFSIGFDESAFDESSHAGLVARACGADHTAIRLRGDELLERLPLALQAMDQPTADGVNSYIISGAVRERGITVALSGLGGDELFGGYPSFARLARVANVARLWGRSPDAFRALAAGAVRAIGPASVAATKAAAVLESDGSMASMFPLMRQLWSVEQRRALLIGTGVRNASELADPYDHLLAGAYAAAPDAELFAQISFAEARTYMHDVLLRDTDQMSMAHSLEVRVPLLDHELVDYVMSVRDVHKQPNGTPKRLLVESLGELLPQQVVHRPKQGFTLPFDPWMRGPLRAFCEQRLGDRGLGGRGLFNAGEVQRLWRSFLDGARDVSWSRLWALVALDAWLDHNALTA